MGDIQQICVCYTTPYGEAKDSVHVNPPSTPAAFLASARRGRGRRSRRKWTFVCVFVALALFFGSLFRSRSRIRSRLWTGSGVFNDDDIQNDGPGSQNGHFLTEWLDIIPSEQLKWQPCFESYGTNLHCARLTVPMDYSRPLNDSADNPKVHLALVMLPGIGHTQQDPSAYAETPLLLNPGGPGGSGAMFAQTEAKSIQAIVGSQHDIIGFDPRGVGASTPKADCFASMEEPDTVAGRKVSLINRLTWMGSGHDIGLVNSSSVALKKQNDRVQAVAKLCGRVDEVNGDASIFRHMSTPNSARDMLSIIHAWDEWRSGGEAEALSDLQPSSENQTQKNDQLKSSSSLRGKLVYWGFSYGTLLGATFASMFPDKVGRVVLDGVVHADYYVEPTWQRSVVDADAIWDKFFVYCAERGSICDFYRAGDSPEDIRRRFTELLGSLEEEPVIILFPDTNVPSQLTASDVKKSVFFAGLYAPIVGFPAIAELLDRTVTGRLGDLPARGGMMALCGDYSMPVWPDDAMKAIACGDKRHKLKENAAELERRFQKAASYSWFADVWFGTDPSLGCNGWEIENKEPPMRWGDNPADKPALIQTNFPILFLSNTLDPVTPLDHALDMTRKFANSSIVEQDGAGHCSSSCVSSCTIAHLQAYFNDGVVPPPPHFESGSSNEGEWTTCSCAEEPWQSPKKSGVGDDLVTVAHMRAYEELRAHFIASNLDQQLDHNNPLKPFLLDRMKLATGLR
ncbi:TAP-like protein-domain-containing protein [Poronia punctata]|nr:TAP-like protein-domain-containing protein [Poronia punctata]